MNLFLTRLDEQQRRWYVALEAKKLGHGGATRMAQITGMHVDTIRRGRDELNNELATGPWTVCACLAAGVLRLKKKARYQRSVRIAG